MWTRLNQLQGLRLELSFLEAEEILCTASHCLPGSPTLLCEWPTPQPGGPPWQPLQSWKLIPYNKSLSLYLLLVLFLWLTPDQESSYIFGGTSRTKIITQEYPNINQSSIPFTEYFID